MQYPEYREALDVLGYRHLVSDDSRVMTQREMQPLAEQIVRFVYQNPGATESTYEQLTLAVMLDVSLFVKDAQKLINTVITPE